MLSFSGLEAKKKSSQAEKKLEVNSFLNQQIEIYQYHVQHSFKFKKEKNNTDIKT